MPYSPPTYFTNMIEEVEDIDKYRTGGFHPVRLGDTYKGKWRYEVLLKLGYGSYSAVWLGRVLDVDPTEYVALKFVVSNPPNKGYEKQVLERLSAPSPSHPGKQYVLHLIGSFTVNGPNGQHDVFVTEPVGPSFTTILSQCYDFSIKVGGALPPGPVTRIARQLLMALDYLRSRCVVHGDIQSGISQRPCQILEGNLKRQSRNIMEAIQDTSLSKGETTNMRTTLKSRIVRGGKLVQPALDLKIVDFGQAFIYGPGQTQLYDIHMPEFYRAPEILVYKRIYLDNPFAADLWSAGCAIFYIATGTILLDSYGLDLLDLLYGLLRVLGETLPSAWIEALPEDDQDDFRDPSPESNFLTLDELIADSYPYQDRQDFVDFLRQILVLRPDKRVADSNLMLLQHRRLQQHLQQSPRPLLQTARTL